MVKVRNGVRGRVMSVSRWHLIRLYKLMFGGTPDGGWNVQVVDVMDEEELRASHLGNRHLRCAGSFGSK